MEATPKKKMSKGCMVGLIIAGVIVVLVIAVVIIGYAYRDNIAKIGVVTVVNQVKTKLASEPVEGVDTVRFNTLVDSFLVRFDSDSLRSEAVQELLPALQTASSSDRTADDISNVEQAIITYYPELENIYQSMELPSDSSTVLQEDSTASSE